MRAHVVIVFGCWDDWGVWEVSSSIYLYSLSVHHARIVQQRVPTPNWMAVAAVFGSVWQAARCGGSSGCSTELHFVRIALW